MTGPIDSAGRALVDTNIIVYAYDIDDAVKHQIAVDLLKALSVAGRFVLSVQILNEFSSVMMRPRRATPQSPDEIATTLRRLASLGDVLPLTSEITFLALDAMPRHGFSFWDSLVWAAAREHGIGTVYSEDFQHGRDIEGVRYVNPFLVMPETG
jgi:predicted nucleic acid-binding protein